MTRIRSRSILLASLSALIGLGVALIAAEYLLRYQRAQILGSDHMDPGLIRYHAQMGWRTVPLWRGRHSHHDFDVTYGTDRYGFRVSPALDESRKRRIAWVGDSFTFGLGVDDGDTFVNRLNLLDRGAAHLNYGIPGFSTDQEWLLIQREVLGFRPDEIVLVVYLGNDLLDNLLDFPLQAVRAKPRFVLEQGRLKLLNRQVPPRLKGPGEARITARSMVLGQEQPEYGWLSRILLRTELARRLRLLPPAEGMEKVFPQRLQPALELFGKLLEAHDGAGGKGRRGTARGAVAGFVTGGKAGEPVRPFPGIPAPTIAAEPAAAEAEGAGPEAGTGEARLRWALPSV
jgi:hypothetical protein